MRPSTQNGEVRTRASVSGLLDGARSRIQRLTPLELADRMATGTVVVDTRDTKDRATEGVIAGSLYFPLSVLLWRADPDIDTTDDRINDLDAPLVIVCNDGYASSWVGAALADLGFTNVADLEGGHRAWVAAGLPVVAAPI